MRYYSNAAIIMIISQWQSNIPIIPLNIYSIIAQQYHSLDAIPKIISPYSLVDYPDIPVIVPSLFYYSPYFFYSCRIISPFVRCDILIIFNIVPSNWMNKYIPNNCLYSQYLLVILWLQSLWVVLLWYSKCLLLYWWYSQYYWW
jgi:hypothetical protein